ncbi:MAG: metal ABC transporter permease [Phycisphaerae bacterium]
MMHAHTITVLLGTSVLGVVSGVIGSFAVLRGRALVGDALAHAALPGVCLVFLITREKNFAIMLLGAVIAGAVSVMILSLLRHTTRIKSDAAIGVNLSVFFGLGIVLSSIAQRSPEGNQAGLDGFIYGKAAGMLQHDVVLIGAVGLGVLVATTLLFKEFTLLSFDRGFAAVQGGRVLLLDGAMMGLIVVTTAIGLPAVGVVLMAAMLIIPGATARFWTDRLVSMVVLAGVLGGAAGAAGTLMSARYAGVPTGPVIVLSGTGFFVLSMLLAPRRGVAATAVAHVRMRRKTARQNLLRTLYELAERNAGDGGDASLDDITSRRAWSTHRAVSLLSRVERDGLVARIAPGAYRLTGQGEAAAADIVRAHRLWELFLIREADIASDHVDRDADEIEHILPRDVVEELEQRLAASGRWPVGAGSAAIVSADAGPAGPASPGAGSLGTASVGRGSRVAGSPPPSPHRIEPSGGRDDV